MDKKERHNEVNRLYYQRKAQWNKISKLFLEILLEDKTYKVYKTDEEKKAVILNRAKEWIKDNREKHNENARKHMNGKCKWKSITNNFRKILL
jgi:hypothetical protein